MRFTAFTRTIACLTALAAFAILPATAIAQSGPAASEVDQARLRTLMNQNTVTIISGTPAGTYLAIAYDMAAVLDSGFDLRVLAVAGKGSVQNVRDILHLRGVDMGIVQSDVMQFFQRRGELGRDLNQRLVYIAKLYNEELHLIAGPGINSVADLAGKKVNFAEVNSGTQFSSRLIFDALKLKVEEVNMGQTDAFAKIKSGEIAATVFIAGRPASAITAIAKDSGLKLVPFKYTAELEASDYLPASLSVADYPNLLSGTDKVETIAIGAVLASYNWPADSDRGKRIAKFTTALFTKFPEFLKAPRHPKWKEVNLAANLKSWRRFTPAQQALERVASANR